MTSKTLRSILVLSFAMSLLTLIPRRVLAQSAPPTQITPSNDSGTNPYGSYSTDAGNVNLSNGNLSLSLPLLTLPGRNGTGFTFALQYDSKIWTPSATYVNGTNIMFQWKSEQKKSWLGDLGWHLAVPSIDPGRSDVDQFGNYLGIDGNTVTLPDGSKHYIVGRATTLDAQDGSGITGTNNASHNLISARLKDGTLLFGTSGHLIEDTNGNFISVAETSPTTTTYTDTLGRQIVATHISGGAGGYSSLSYKDSNGLTQTITFGFTSIPLFQTSGPYQTPQPPFTYPQPANCPSCHRNIYVSQPATGNRTLLTSVTLADGTQYTFSYNGYGELTKITYPTGGYTAYVYAPAVHLETFWSSTGFNIKGDFREVKERHICRDASGTCGGGGTPEDITIFTPTISETQPNNAAMDVVDPLGYRNHYEFTQSDAVNYPDVSWPRETLHSVYSETGALLRTTQTTYYGMDTYCACPAYPKDVTTTLDDTGGTALVTKTHYDYDTFQSTVMWPLYDPSNGVDYTNQTPTNRPQPLDNPTQVLEYNYGSGAAGTLARKTVNTWLKVNAANSNVDYSTKTVHIWNRKATTQTWDGGTTKFAETDFEYDNYSTDPLSVSGAVQHDTVYGTSNKTRGNLTATKRWRNTDGAFLTTRFAYDDAGNATKSVDPLNHTTVMSYADSWGNGTCTPSGGNAAAFLTAVTNALSQVTRSTYNSCSGSMASFTDPNSQVTSYSYDLMGRQTHAGFPDGGATDRTFYTTSRPFSVTVSKKLDSTRNVVSQTFVDGLARITQTILCEDGATCSQKIKTDTTYDGLGRTSTATNPYRTTSDATYGVTKTLYDALNRPCVVIPPDGTAVTGNACPASQPTNDVFTTYVGNITTITDQAGKRRKSVTDAMGRLVQVFEDPTSLNYETDYVYDPLDNLTCVAQKGTNTGTFSNCASTPASWRPRSFVYDSLSRLTQAVNPEPGNITYKYDSDTSCGAPNSFLSLLVSQTDARGIRTCFTYDALNRVTTRIHSDGTPNSYFSYDTNPGWMNPPSTNLVGRLVEANNDFAGQSGTTSAAAIVNSYDAMGRIVRQWQQTPSVSPGGYFTYSSYDLAGNLKSATDASGTVISYSYDSAGRPSTVTSSYVDANHPATLYTVDPSLGYFPNAAIRKATLSNGLTQTAMYNNRLQPCRMEINSTAAYLAQCNSAVPSGNLLDFSYGYNVGSTNNGNVASWSSVGNQSFARSYGYDSLNRISTMSDTAASQACKGLSWTVDAWGNMTDQTVTSGSCLTQHVGVGTNNRLVSPYQYDVAGNMTYDGTHTYTYDAENHLTKVDNGSTATYGYDANGRRIRKDSGGSWTEYFYDTAGNISSERALPYFTVIYAYLGSQMIAQYRDDTTYSIFRDHLGSARLITKLDKSIYDSLDFLPFGAQVTGDTGTTHKFTGKERDAESGLDNFGARYDSSGMGRFMSPDPMGGQQDDPQSLNRYAYVRNNPLNLTDPTGLNFNLACAGPDTATCKGGLQGTTTTTTDANGKQTSTFTATEISNDKNGNLVDQNGKKYNGTVDGSGVQFSQQGSDASSKGIWVNGSPDTKFTQTSGALAGFSFDFQQTSKEQTAKGTFYYPGAPRDAYDAVLKAGFSASMADDFFNPLHGYIGSYHYRSDGDPGTGKNSGHLIIRGVGILHPWDTVPTKGELHFGETNPNVNRIEHFRKDVF